MQIQLPETMLKPLRDRAYQQRISVSGIIRELLTREFFRPKARKYRLADFSFVGASRSRGKGAGKISARHDEALAENFAL